MFQVDIATKDEDIPLEDRYKIWIDEAARELDMDICAMDVLQDKDGKEYILEVSHFYSSFNFFIFNLMFKSFLFDLI